MTKLIGKKGMSILCALALVASLVAGPGSVASAAAVAYTGQTAVGDYTIGTATQLAELARKVNAGTLLSGSTFTLTANINLANSDSYSGLTSWTGGSNWTPIGGGTAGKSFLGVFDGNGKTISNLYCSQSANDTGLFGKLEEGGVLKNLTLAAPQVSGTRSVGAFVGRSWGTVDNCHTSGGTVTGSQAKGLGGIVGANWVNTTTNPPVISNCSNSASVTSTYSSGSAGGIAGENEGQIFNCSNSGSVTSPYNAGGLVGSNKNDYSNQSGTGGTVYGGINNSYNRGTVNGKVAGGIAAYQMGSMRNCYNSASVTGSSYAGQLIGEINSSLTNTSLFYDSNYTTAAVGNSTSVPATSFTAGSTILTPLNNWVSANNVGGIPYKTWLLSGGYPVFA